MSNATRVLYIGVTNDLNRRVGEHKSGQIPAFSATYQTKTLVYYEETSDVREALAREKQLKGWTRIRKCALVESMNPEWRDLSVE